MLKLGFLPADVMQMPEAELEGWLKAAGLLGSNKTYVVKNRKRKKK